MPGKPYGTFLKCAFCPRDVSDSVKTGKINIWKTQNGYGFVMKSFGDQKFRVSQGVGVEQNGVLILEGTNNAGSKITLLSYVDDLAFEKYFYGIYKFSELAPEPLALSFDEVQQYSDGGWMSGGNGT